MKSNLKQILAVQQKLISDMDNLLIEAIKDKNWSRASELENYISGMSQIAVLWENYWEEDK